MNEIEEEVMRAAANLGLSETQFRQCSASDAADVVTKAKDRFVEGNPRTWWLSLKRPCKMYPYESGGHELLLSHVPNGERRCWFIPETEETTLPVFECDVGVLSPLLADCFFFEYYVLSSRFDWLIVDTDHNELLVCS
jgi:hypothetical protein